MIVGMHQRNKADDLEALPGCGDLLFMPPQVPFRNPEAIVKVFVQNLKSSGSSETCSGT
jgi:hypothetical protein